LAAVLGSDRFSVPALAGPRCLIFALLTAGASAEDVRDPSDPAAGWTAYGRDPGGSQYSPLARINRENVDTLELAWMHRSGDVINAEGFEGTSYEVTPIVASDRLYYCTPLNRVFALDAVTGEEKWVFDPDAAKNGSDLLLVSEPRTPGLCRGVAYWQDSDETGACAQRIFKGDMDGRLYAIDADTGLACEDFGKSYGHPGYVSANDFDNGGEGWWSITSPPAVIGDLIVAGAAVDDKLTNANDGIVRAFDARTGKLRWEFNPVPADLSEETGGGNVWTTISVDEQRKLVFLPTTSLSPDYFGGNRGLGSPYENAVVAVDASDGQVRWHYQILRHDLFDYDLPSHPILVAIRKDDQAQDVAIQITKMGQVYVLDRENGEPVFAVEDRPVPVSDIPEETSATSQRHSVGIEPFSPQSLSAEDIFGLSLFDEAWCRSWFKRSRYEGPFTPPSAEGSILFPSIQGGGNWGGAAFSPPENLLIVRSSNLATWVQLYVPKEPDAEVISLDYRSRQLPLRGTPYWVRVKAFVSPLGVPCNAPPWGTLTAVDMGTGRMAWQVALGQVKQWGLTIPESAAWGSPLLGGPIATAGGLVFIAAAMDQKLRALDIQTGELLWEYELPAPGMAVPITYEAGKRQYVVIAAGGNSHLRTRLADAIVAFTLPD